MAGQFSTRANILAKLIPEHDLQSEDPRTYLLLPMAIRHRGNRQLQDFGLLSDDGSIDELKFNAYFGVSASEAKSRLHSVFLRQFERLDPISNDEVVLRTSVTEFPTHRSPTIGELLSDAGSSLSGKSICRHISYLFQSRRYFPEYFSHSNIVFGDIQASTMALGAQPGHTPWIPIEATLQILDAALKVLFEWADKIVDIYIAGLDHFSDRNLLVPLSVDDTCRDARNSWVTRRAKRIHGGMEIAGFAPTGARGHQEIRDLPYLSELVSVAIGACNIIIAAMKPMRVSELQSCPFECLSWKRGDGWWLTTSLSKSGIEGVLPLTSKPIPQICAKAVKIIQRLNRAALKLSTDSEKQLQAQYLFFLPQVGLPNPTRAQIWSTESIERSIERFSDYVETPLDKRGRRYYVNVHEYRKSFLLAFFWQFKYSSLEACRWMASHKDITHIFAYLEANVPGEEISEIEAEYAQMQMRFFARDGSLCEMENVEALYNHVCSSFRVRTIDLIPESELHRWVKRKLFEGTYEIVTHEFAAMDGRESVQIAFRVNEYHG